MAILYKLRLFRKWWQRWHTMPVFSWLRAAALYKTGHYAKAIPLYEQGLANHSGHPAQLCARLDLAYCLFRTGRVSEAEEELRLAASLAPQSREAQLRLAHFQIYKGCALEAAWTMHRLLKRIEPDAEIVATFLSAAVEGAAPAYLLKEASSLAGSLALDAKAESQQQLVKLQIARAREKLINGNFEAGRAELSHLAARNPVIVDAVTAFSELLLKEGKVAFARQLLRRSLAAAPTYPRLLSLLAESYLLGGPFYNPAYAVQLATAACQNSSWSSPRELHVLAEAYFHHGDKVSALLMAGKAKEEGSRLLGSYRDVKSLERLIESLSSGTLS